MRLKSALALLSFSLLCLVPKVTFADTLTLTDSTGGSIDGEDVYPYNFTVTGPNGTDHEVSLSCLNFDREVSFGETWQVDPLQMSTVNANATYDGESGLNFLEDAWLFNQYNTSAATDSEIQFAIWSIMDPGTINAGNSSYNNAGAFDATAQALAAQAAVEAATLPSAYFANDVAFLPDASGSGTWTNGQPQIFMVDPAPPAVTPEPTSLILLGTGMFLGVAILQATLARAH